jgi:hypothetical protein
LGRVVLDKEFPLPAETGSTTLSLSDIPTGAYGIAWRTGDVVLHKKLIVVK